MSSQEVVRRSFDAWNADDRDAHRATFADDAVLKEHATGLVLHGADAIADHHFAWRAAFPGMTGHLDVLIGGGNGTAVIETVWEGTHRAPLTAPDGSVIPATGRDVRIPAALCYRVADDHITEVHHYFDLLTMLRQLGVA